MPPDLRFSRRFLEPHEHIDRIAHKHGMALLKPMLTTVPLGVILPALLLWLYWTPKMMLISGLWLLGGVLYSLYKIVDWYLDMLVFTDAYIVDIEWKGFFHKETKRIDYSAIESVSYETKGILPTIFKYGNLTIVTPGHDLKGLQEARHVQELQQYILNKRNALQAPKPEVTLDVEILKKAMQSLLNLPPQPSDPISPPEPVAVGMTMEKKAIRDIPIVEIKTVPLTKKTSHKKPGRKKG